MLPELRATWLHNFLDDNSKFAASFAGGGAATTFSQLGVPVGRDAVDVGAGLSFAIAQTTFPAQISGFVQYDATLGSHQTANAFAGGIKVRW